LKKVIKRLLLKVINKIVNILSSTKSGQYIVGQIASTTMQIVSNVKYQGTELSFITPNNLNKFRINSFASKEPETLEWIDSIPQGAILWDVGANVGLYSCYAAKSRNCMVYAFEPSIFNLELLARNVYINQLTDLVTIISLPLCEAISKSSMNMTSTDWGGALSTFGQNYGFDGNKMDSLFEFSTVGISMDKAVSVLGLEQPDYIKLDVDGIEHLILSGGKQVLANVKGVLVEVNDNFKQQASSVILTLEEAGLSLKEKRHAEIFDKSDLFQNTYNQIWTRN